MSDTTYTPGVTTHKDALWALGLMTAAILVANTIWQDGPGTILGIVSFCLFLMTIIAATLFLLEGRLDRQSSNPILGFCLPAIGILGFCEALFVAAGFWMWSAIVLFVAFAFSAHRRRLMQGPFNLLPSAAVDMGLVGGIGAAWAGFFLIAINAMMVV